MASASFAVVMALPPSRIRYGPIPSADAPFRAFRWGGERSPRRCCSNRRRRDSTTSGRPAHGTKNDRCASWLYPELGAMGRVFGVPIRIGDDTLLDQQVTGGEGGRRGLLGQDEHPLACFFVDVPR